MFTYTANGEMETKTDTSTGEEWMFQYDALGNLLSVGLPNGDLVEYLLDGRGRRIGKKKNGALLKQWIYGSALRVAAELDGAGNLVSQFAYGSKVNVPDYVLRSGKVYRVIADQLGSPREVVNVADPTDVPYLADYSTFGEVNGTGLDWLPFGFAGGLFDRDSDMLRYWKRDFDPRVGRWVSKEPLRFRGGRNFYVYALNDPANLVDRTGREPEGAGGVGGASGYGGAEGAGGQPYAPPPLPRPLPLDATHDYCGSLGSEWVPESDPLGSSNYQHACDIHDTCYGTCGAEKISCDWDLSENMASECREQGDSCNVAAVSYMAGLNLPLAGGQSAFDRNQSDCVCMASGYAHGGQ